MIVKPKEHCKWDFVALGEVMLRFDPGDGRISTARRCDVYEGGGEYNGARGLKRCFGLDTAIVTAFVDNPVGRLLQDLIYQGGVDQSLVKWVGDDGRRAPDEDRQRVPEPRAKPVHDTPRQRHRQRIGELECGYDPAVVGFTPVQILRQRRFQNSQRLPVDVIDGRGEKQQPADHPPGV